MNCTLWLNYLVCELHLNNALKKRKLKSGPRTKRKRSYFFYTFQKKFLLIHLYNPVYAFHVPMFPGLLTALLPTRVSVNHHTHVSKLRLSLSNQETPHASQTPSVTSWPHISFFPKLALSPTFYTMMMGLLGWPKTLPSFFCKIKGTFFIFTNNFIDWDILSMLALSHHQLLVGERPGVLLNIHQWRRQPHSKEFFGQNVNSTKKLCKPLLTHSISHSTFFIYCTNRFFAFQLHFYLSWNNKA